MNLGLRLAAAEQECDRLRAELEKLGKDKASNDADYLKLSARLITANRVIEAGRKGEHLDPCYFQALSAYDAAK